VSGRNFHLRGRRTADRQKLPRLVREQGFRCCWCGAGIVSLRQLRKWGAEIEWKTHHAVRYRLGDDVRTVLRATVEHVVPLIEAGPESRPENLRAACVLCNELRKPLNGESKSMEEPVPKTALLKLDAAIARMRLVLAGYPGFEDKPPFELRREGKAMALLIDWPDEVPEETRVELAAALIDALNDIHKAVGGGGIVARISNEGDEKP
jgi:hypothetical protein